MTFTVHAPGWKKDQGYAGRTLGWVKDAVRVLWNDALRPENAFTNIGEDLDHLSDILEQMADSSGVTEIEDAINTYDRLRSMITPYAAAPIDVLVPNLINSEGEAPPIANTDALQQAMTVARRILPDGDALRAAIETEATWARGQHEPGWFDSHFNLSDDTPEQVAMKRIGRIAAWARTALHKLQARAAPQNVPAHGGGHGDHAQAAASQPAAHGVDAPIDATAAVTVSERGDTQNWLRHAVNLLRSEAHSAQVPADVKAAVHQLRTLVHSIDVPGLALDPGQIASIAGQYEQLRMRIAGYEPHAYAAPPISVLIPTIDTGTHPEDVSASELAVANQIAVRLLDPNDLLRQAIQAWSNRWQREAMQGYEVRYWDPQAHMWRMDTSDAVAHMRARRIASWARSKLAAMFPQDAAAQVPPRQFVNPPPDVVAATSTPLQTNPYIPPGVHGAEVGAIELGETWDHSNRELVLPWARDAVDLLVRDSHRPGNQSAGTYVDALAEAIRTATTAADEAEVQRAVNAYSTLRGTMSPYASPPIDVIVPTVTDDRVPAPPEEDVVNLTRAATLADRLLPAGDDLRGAIDRWNEWWTTLSHGSTMGNYLLRAIADRLALTTPESLNERRARRLAAWANSRLRALHPDETHDPVPAPGEERGMAPRQSHVGGGGGGLLLLAAAAAAMAFGKKGRRGR